MSEQENISSWKKTYQCHFYLYFRFSVLCFSCPYYFSESFRELLDVLSYYHPILARIIDQLQYCSCSLMLYPIQYQEYKIWNKVKYCLHKSFPPVLQLIFAYTLKSQSEYPREENIKKFAFKYENCLETILYINTCGHKKHFNIPPV